MRVLTLTTPRMQGPDVVKVQRALGVPANGIFGPATAQAVARWKRKAGYPDGEINAGLGIRGQEYLLGLTPFPQDYVIRATQRACEEYVPQLMDEKDPFGAMTRPAPSPLSWPVQPFDGPHGIRGTFGEPRGLVGVAGARGLEGDALANFLAHLNPVLVAARRIIHHGIDVIADDGTPVYALTNGVARWGGSANYSRFVRVGDFEYVHLKDPVAEGTRVTAFKTVIGTVFPGQEHVHLTRYVAGQPVNPLTLGGMKNYVDTAAPRIYDLSAYRDDGTVVDLQAISGSVALYVNATDVQSERGNETGVYTLAYEVKDAAGATVVGPYRVFQLVGWPPEAIGNIMYSTPSTRHRFQPAWRYRLSLKSPSADGLLHTGHLAPGDHTVGVFVSDAMGNATSKQFPIRIVAA